MTYAKFARLAALGALAATAGLIALYLLFVFFTRPTATGGMNWSTALVTWVSIGTVVVMLAAVHVVLGLELLAAAREGEPMRR
jgi:hypothetical protein